MKKMKRKGLMKNVAMLVAAVMVVAQCAMPVSAYFERGTVSISAGKSSVTLTEGASETVSVSMSPASDSQLPGCGMAECPQICGDKECLDENGECACNGTTYTTYYAYASASSSNTSVATASYDNGTVTIKGVSAGIATITLTSALRQYTSSTTTIEVTVEAKESGSSGEGGSGDNSGSGSGSGGNGSSGNGSSGSNSGSGSGSSGGSNSGSGSGSSGGNSGSGSGRSSGSNSGSGENGSSGSAAGEVSVTKVSGNDTSDPENDKDTEKDGEETDENGLPEGVTSIESDRGLIYFVPITAGTMGSEWLKLIQGKEEYVDFQMKDEADTVLYAWEFYGMDVKNVTDIDYTIETGNKPFDGCSYGTSSDSIYIAFAHDGDLPGKASVFLRADNLAAEDVLNLYCYDAQTNTVTLVQEAISVENCYVTLELEHCSQYILTTETLENAEPEEVIEEEEKEIKETKAEEEPVEIEEAGQNVPVKAIVVIVVIVIVAAAVIGVVCWRKKKNQNNENADAEEEEAK